MKRLFDILFSGFGLLFLLPLLTLIGISVALTSKGGVFYKQIRVGKGNIDFTKMIKKLKEVGYNGVLSAEYEAQVSGWELSEQDILKTNYEFIKNIIN